VTKKITEIHAKKNEKKHQKNLKKSLLVSFFFMSMQSMKRRVLEICVTTTRTRQSKSLEKGKIVKNTALMFE
jgi:hypothetical protein